MGYLINQKDFINENVFKFEKRLESQYTIFLDRSPTFVNYYHITNIDSTADNGFGHVEQIIGKDSPLRYQKISDLPIFGIENIKLDLSDEDEGLNTSFDADGVILPNTVKPFPDDFFIVTYLDKSVLFKVTSVNYDTIKSNNFYTINFSLYSIDNTIDKLEEQVVIRYNCIFDNIGTDEKCIIQEDATLLMNEIEKIYSTYIESYKRLYYKKKYNSFLYRWYNHFIYDKYITNFINANQLFERKDNFNTIYLSNEDYGELFDIEYAKTFYKQLEEIDKDGIKRDGYIEAPITYQQSVFIHYGEDDVKSIRFTPCNLTVPYISDKLIDNILANNYDAEDITIFEKLIIKYFNKDYESIYGLEIEELKKYRFEYTREEFIYVPIVLFILKYYMHEFIHV